MCRKSSCLIIGLSGLLLLNGCHTPPKRSVEAPDDRVATERDRTVDRRARTHAHYAAGLLHDMNNEGDKALDEFFKAAQSDPRDEVLVLEVTRRLSQNKQFEKALELLVPAAAQPDATAAVISRLGMVYS